MPSLPHLHPLILLLPFLPHSHSTSTNTTTLTFDTLSPPTLGPPIYSPPSPHHHLSFHGFSVFDPQDDSLRNIIIPSDRNCAVSRPNALLGARIGGDGGVKAAFGLAAGSEGRGSGVMAANYSSFNLLGMSVKPLAAPDGPEEIRVVVKGWKVGEGEAMAGRIGEVEKESVEWYVDFPVGYHLPLNASLPGKFEGLEKVEMWADYGPQELDWEFCIDDLKLRFNDNGDTKRKEDDVKSQQAELEL